MTRSALALLILLLVFAAPACAGEPSSCVRCHTDDTAIKALFAPPTIGASEGEG